MLLSTNSTICAILGTTVLNQICWLTFLFIMAHNFLLLAWLVYIWPGLVKLLFFGGGCCIFLYSYKYFWDLSWNADRKTVLCFWGLIINFGRWSQLSILCKANCVPQPRAPWIMCFLFSCQKQALFSWTGVVDYLLCPFEWFFPCPWNFLNIHTHDEISEFQG